MTITEALNKAIINIKSKKLLTKFRLGEEEVGRLRSNYEINHKLNGWKEELCNLKEVHIQLSLDLVQGSQH
jgi:hypothetical protein